MSTISDLVSQHSKVPGDIRVITYGAVKYWFQPFFSTYQTDCSCTFHGLNSAGNADHHLDHYNKDWQLYTEPKPKVSMVDLAYSLYGEIAHGDFKHRSWLREKIQSHFGIELAPIQDEPKPKVMRAQYLVIPKSHIMPFTTDSWYLDEKDARSRMMHDSYDDAPFIRLEERAFER